jgi:FkbM family methyltransferase
MASADVELSVIRLIGHCLPPIPHATALINRVLKPLYLRKARPSVTAQAWGLTMRLNPAEAVDGGILFYPQLYNRLEFKWLRNALRPNDLFVDVGSYIGAYSLLAASQGARVIAVEANPEAFAVLTENIRLNGLAVTAVNLGASDRDETLQLFLQRRQNLGGSSFIVDGGDRDCVSIRCKPLDEIAPGADVMKIDVEGMEMRVLQPYLLKHKPRVIILETCGAETDALALCKSHGYGVAGTTYENVLLQRGT